MPSPSTILEPPADGQRQRSEAAPTRARWALLAAGLVVVVSSLLLFAGRDSTEDSIVVTPTAEPAASSQAGPASDVAPGADGTDVVAAFAAGWASGDWACLGGLASEPVLATAREWHAAGLQVEVVGALSTDAFQLLVIDPAGSSGLTFSATVGADASGAPIVTGLAFTGDAG